SALPQSACNLAVAVPGFGHMAIGGEQSRSNYKPSSSHPRAIASRAPGDVINPIDVSDRFPSIVHRSRRKRLLVFQVRYLARKLVHLLLQTGVVLGSVVMRHDSRAHQRQHAEQRLHKPLPGLDEIVFALVGIEHEGSARRRDMNPGSSHYPDLFGTRRVGYRSRMAADRK